MSCPFHVFNVGSSFLYLPALAVCSNLVLEYLDFGETEICAVGRRTLRYNFLGFDAMTVKLKENIHVSFGNSNMKKTNIFNDFGAFNWTPLF